MNHCFLASGTFSRTHGKEGMPKGPGLFKPAFRRSVSKVDPSKCQATSSGGQDSAAAGDSVEERIRRAREYRYHPRHPSSSINCMVRILTYIHAP